MNIFSLSEWDIVEKSLKCYLENNNPLSLEFMNAQDLLRKVQILKADKESRLRSVKEWL